MGEKFGTSTFDRAKVRARRRFIRVWFALHGGCLSDQVPASFDRPLYNLILDFTGMMALGYFLPV
jgi:hypothetical protein